MIGSKPPDPLANFRKLNKIRPYADIETKLVDSFKDWEATLNGEKKSTWNKTKREAIKAFQNLGLPGNKQEEYKYTPLSKSLNSVFDFKILSTPSNLTEADVTSGLIPDLEANQLFFFNGRLVKKDIQDKGLIVADLPHALIQDEKLVLKYLAKYADYRTDAFRALNTAFTHNQGVFIRVEPGAIIEKPVALYFFSDSREENSLCHPRNLILAEENCQVSFLEYYHTVGSKPSLTNAVSEIVVNSRARVDYYKVQSDQENSYHIDNTHIYQAASSYFSGAAISLRGKMIRNNLVIALDGEGCETHMHGLYVLKGSSHVDNHTTVDHLQPNSYSNELYKGIMDEQSSGVFNGKIFVRQPAQKTNAYQSNPNILLSDEASINTKPQLEIWADDVKCSHGATTGQLDEEQLFYLRSRGLDLDHAKAILLYAFAKEALEYIKIDPLRNYLDTLVSNRLHKN